MKGLRGNTFSSFLICKLFVKFGIFVDQLWVLIAMVLLKHIINNDYKMTEGDI